jgi:hypothetical protein
VIRRQGPWRHLDAVEFATLEWVDWFNHRRLLEPIGDLPPGEYTRSSTISRRRWRNHAQSSAPSTRRRAGRPLPGAARAGGRALPESFVTGSCFEGQLTTAFRDSRYDSLPVRSGRRRRRLEADGRVPVVAPSVRPSSVDTPTPSGRQFREPASPPGVRSRCPNHSARHCLVTRSSAHDGARFPPY